MADSTSEIPISWPKTPDLPLRAIILVIVLLAAIAITAYYTFGSVEVGYVSVIVDPIAQSVNSQGDGASSQFFFKPPWANKVDVYVGVEAVHMFTDIGTTPSTGDFPAIGCITEDGLGVEVDVTVTWSILPSEVVNLYKKFPKLDWRNGRIIPIIRETVRDVTSQYTAIETLEARGEVGIKLSESLTQTLAEDTALASAIFFGSADLREIALPSGFIAAIEAKLAAEQMVAAAEYNKTRILVIANATAQQKIIEAQGAGEALIVVANATAESMAIIAEESGMDEAQLAQLYLTLEALKEMAVEGEANFIIVTGQEGFTWVLPVQPTD